jgi:hypothetical protein
MGAQSGIEHSSRLKLGYKAEIHTQEAKRLVIATTIIRVIKTTTMANQGQKQRRYDS